MIKVAQNQDFKDT